MSPPVVVADRDSTASRANLVDLGLIFLKLGTTAFGGPAAHIAMMRSEFVDRRHWLSEAEFLDLVGASSLIPGPSSTELAIHIGLRRAGWTGLILAGTCFILPASLIVTAIAWAYVRFGQLPQAAGLLYGIKPVIIAVVLQALWGLGRTALKTRLLAAVGLVTLVLAFLGVPPLALLFGTGGALGVWGWFRHEPNRTVRPLLALGAVASFLVVVPIGISSLSRLAPRSPGLWPLFLVFLKIGSVLYGSGYVLLAFLSADLVTHLHWLTQTQILDATAVGQITPGPVFTTATFIGYLLAGGKGALIATVAIFLPAFLLVAVSRPIVLRLRQSPTAAAFLDGVNVASLALMAHVTWQLGRASIVDISTFAVAAVSAVFLFRYKINSAWLVLGGALIGSLVYHSG